MKNEKTFIILNNVYQGFMNIFYISIYNSLNLITRPSKHCPDKYIGNALVSLTTEPTMVVYWVVVLFGAAFASDCNVLKTKNGSVCVCNSTQCDSFPQLSALNRNQYQIYTTSKEKLGYWKVLKTFENVRRQYKSPHTIRVNRNRRLQTIIGFGGAFTDATGINILAMSGKVQSLLVESLFGATGNAYTLCRFPIGGTDFSLRNYSLNDAPDDTTLNNFSLQQEDFNYRVSNNYETIYV